MDASSRARVVVLIPALYAEQALPLVLRDLPRAHFDVVIVVDNGSHDGTSAVARAGGALVVRENQRGYGRACLRGLALVLGSEPAPVGPGSECLPLGDDDIVVFLDGDHSDHPEELPQLLAPLLERKADFVLGSRTLIVTNRSALTPQQRFGNALACGLMRVFFGARYSDLGPFRALRVGALKHLEMRDRDYGWTVEMQLKAKIAELATLEVPVQYRVRRLGVSKVSGTLVGSLRAGWKILGWILVWRARITFRRIPKYLPRVHSARR